MEEEVTTFTQLRMLAERSKASQTDMAIAITQAIMDVAEVAGDAQQAADAANAGVSELEEEISKLNGIKNFTIYFCLWDSGIEAPPSDDVITPAICGEATCGLTICGVTDGQFWQTNECYTIDGLYKWVVVYLEFEDDTTKYLGPYCLTDNYTRNQTNQLETDLTNFQNQVIDIINDTADTINTLNDSINGLDDVVSQALQAIETAQNTADDAKSIATNASDTATTAQSTATSAQTVANEARTTAQAASLLASNSAEIASSAQAIANQANSTANTANQTANSALSLATLAQNTSAEAQSIAESAHATAQSIAATTIASSVRYFCLWYSNSIPPNDGQITDAICGTAVCGQTICGVTDGVVWRTDEPTVTDGLYKWIRWLYTFGDGHTEWGDPYCLTDEYSRDVESALQSDMSTVKNQINNIIDEFNDTVESLNDAIDGLDESIVNAESLVDSAWIAANTAQETAQVAQEIAKEAQLSAQTAQQTAQSLVSRSISSVLTADNWDGTEAPYIQTLSIEIDASQNGIIGIGQGLDQEQILAAASAVIVIQSQGDGSLTIAAYGDKPQVDIPVNIILFG